MNTTPTPGDLSARHVEVLRHLLDCHGNHTVIDDDDASALTAAIAALSALPAAGGVRPYFKDEAALIQFLDSLCELDGEGGDGQFKWKPAQRAIAGIKATTPQPSAVEVPSPLGNWHEPAIATVGAQGDGWQDKVLEILRPLLDTGDSRTADDKAVAIYAILANAAPAATPTDEVVLRPTDGGEGKS